MKKLVFALVAVAMGMCANAASLQWTMLKVSTYSGATSYTSYLVEKGNFSTALAAVNAILAGGTDVDGFLYSQAGATYTASGKTYVKSTAIVSSWDAPASVTAGAQIDYYSIMIASDSKGAIAWLSATDDAASTQVSSAGKLTAAYSNLSAQSWTEIGGDDPEPTPEPTSGVLLLLGVASLALRRKQK